MKKIDVYLVSDSTGETVSNIARSSLAHFDGILIEEHLWSFVKTKGKLDKLKNAIIKKPGIVMYTIINKELRQELHEICDKLKIICIPVLSKIIKDLSNYLDIKVNEKSGNQYELNDDYYDRVESVNYSISHDDGQLTSNLDVADIILIGVSRTSKSPTCLYLAYKGFRTANIPYILGQKISEEIFANKNALIVGLTINPEILIEIRKKRILTFSDDEKVNYIDEEKVEEEIREAKKIFQKNNLPIIDVTRRSVEETSALILQLYEKKKIREKRESSE